MQETQLCVEVGRTCPLNAAIVLACNLLCDIVRYLEHNQSLSDGRWLALPKADHKTGNQGKTKSELLVC